MSYGTDTCCCEGIIKRRLDQVRERAIEQEKPELRDEQDLSKEEGQLFLVWGGEEFGPVWQVQEGTGELWKVWQEGRMSRVSGRWFFAVAEWETVKEF